MGKYAPLTRFLREQEQPHITLRFSELEEVLGFSLPESAYKYASWWANSAKQQSQVKGWLDAGWETRDVDLRGRKVTFVRVAGEPVAAPGEAKAAASARQMATQASAAPRRAQAAGGSVLDKGLAGSFDLAKLPPGARRLLESRAARHGRKMAEEAAMVLAASLAEERAMLAGELAQMRARTERAAAFDLLDVLGRKRS